ncbi:MAG: ABC transporter ATP-binding protein [Acidimicrobiaceae bacterium]|nr:ABC transporter ATP-binding protein [Acidimicrobiaceae bacterium]
MIHVRELTKHYRETVAVHDLSFDVPPGVVTGFLGPNGSGKSTTMRMIMGLDRPDEGSVTINGRAYVALDHPLREVGALLEAKAIHPGRSARHHLQYLAETNGISRQRVDEVLDLVGLTEVASRRVGKFSLGMGQRLGIAAALLGDPGVLLFDEPINGLDPEGILWVRNLLRGLAAEGRSVFVSSHLMSEMALTADRLVVIGRGALISEGTLDEFIADTAGTYVKVRGPQLAEIERVLHAAGATVVPDGEGALTVRGWEASAIGDLVMSKQLALHELSPQTASLEEAFMTLTRDSVEYHGRTTDVPVTTGK